MGTIKSVAESLRCEYCGNKNRKCFEVLLGGERHVFDSFECAMHALSPRCGYCNCKIQGPGVFLGITIYCSYQCANDDHVREYEARVLTKQLANS